MENIEEQQIIKKDWVRIYPCYLDKNLKTSEGRRINLELAIPNISIHEIAKVTSQLYGFKTVLEGKHHSTDWIKRGRVLVEIKKNGDLINKNVNNSNILN